MLFDLDGTLADTVPSLHLAVLGALRSVGLPDISQEMTRSFVGNGAMMLLARAVTRTMDPDLANVDKDLLKRAREGFNITYASCCDCKESIYPGGLKPSHILRIPASVWEFFPISPMFL